MIAEHESVADVVRIETPQPIAPASDMVHREFFGDAERAFKITPTLIPELERKTGAGIGTLCQRLFAGQFSHADMLETIRLGLIGGGEHPERAAELVASYVPVRPFVEAQTLAVAILETLWFGSADEGEQ